MKAISLLFKRLFCGHAWRRSWTFGSTIDWWQREYVCVKCGKRCVRDWPYVPESYAEK